MAYNVISVGELNAFRLLDDLTHPLSQGQLPLTRTVEATEHRLRHVRYDWVSEGTCALNVPGIAVSDYSITSLGNMKRVDAVIDWVQQRSLRVDGKIAARIGRESLPGTRAPNATIDHAPADVWELYRFMQRVAVDVIDEPNLNGIEDRADSAINLFRSTPKEVIVKPGRVHGPQLRPAGEVRIQSPGSAAHSGSVTGSRLYP